MAGIADILNFFSRKPEPSAAGAGRGEVNPDVVAPEKEREIPPWLKGYDVNTLPEIPDQINAYRADPTGKYGGKEGIETQPMKLYAPQLYSHARALGHAEGHGVPKMDAQALANIALMEGRPNFGNNPYAISRVDPGQKKSVELFKKLIASGVPENVADFPVKIFEKNNISKQKNISFEQAWNGLGKTSKGRSGADYARDIESGRSASAHKNNAPLVALINQALEAGRNDYKSSNAKKSPTAMPENYRSGGRVRMI
jgi:hypothetical protein